MNDLRCDNEKNGRFDKLRCCLAPGHTGPCNYVVFGVVPYEPGSQRKCSDADHAKRVAKRIRLKVKAKE